MKVVVVGGTGRVGSELVDTLRTLGHDVSPASRRLGVDTITRVGLQEAIDGAQVVVDLVDSHTVEEGPARWFFETSAQHLLAAERAAGVGHHVGLSMAGVDRVDGGYFRAKLAQEERIRSSGVSYTILRSTRVFESLGEVADDATDGGVVRLAPVRIQPLALRDLTTALARIASAPPLNGTITVAGPEQFDLDVLTQRVLTATRDAREVVSDSRAYYLGAELRQGEDALLPEIRIAQTRFEDWLPCLASPVSPGSGWTTLMR